MVETHVSAEETHQTSDDLEADDAGAFVVVPHQFSQGVGYLIAGVAGEEEGGVAFEDVGYAVFEGEGLGSGDELEHAHDEGVDQFDSGHAA